MTKTRESSGSVHVIISILCTNIFNLITFSLETLNLLIDEQTSHTHTRANAHAGQEDFLLLSPAFTQTSDNLSCACAAERMTQSNGTSPDVELGVVDLEGLEAVDCHGGKGLVDLDEVNVLQSQVELGEQFGDGDGWADTHDAGSKTGERLRRRTWREWVGQASVR